MPYPDSNLLYPHQVFKFPAPEDQYKNLLYLLSISKEFQGLEDQNRLIGTMKEATKGKYEDLPGTLAERGFPTQALEMQKAIGQKQMELQAQTTKETKENKFKFYETLMRNATQSKDNDALQQIISGFKQDPLFREEFKDFAMTISPDTGKTESTVNLSAEDIAGLKKEHPQANFFKTGTYEPGLYNMTIENKQITGLKKSGIEHAQQLSTQWLYVGESDKAGNELYELNVVNEQTGTVSPVLRENERIRQTHQQLLGGGAKKKETVELPPFEKKLAEKAGGKAGEDIVESRKNADSSLIAIKAIDTGMSNLEQGIYSGHFANLKLNLAKIISAMGIKINGETTANTETYQTVLNRLVGPIITDFNKGIVSDADRDFGVMIAGGNITLEKSTLERLLKINREIEVHKITNYNEKSDKLRKINPEIGDYFDKINIPETETKKTVQPESNQQESKKELIYESPKFRVEAEPSKDETKTRPSEQKLPLKPSFKEKKISPQPFSSKDVPYQMKLENAFEKLTLLFGKEAHKEVIDKATIEFNKLKDENQVSYNNFMYDKREEFRKLYKLYKERFIK